eukprot:scaffold1626_cov372-Prasinococcus_capsulatus_cf.AAC.12
MPHVGAPLQLPPPSQRLAAPAGPPPPPPPRRLACSAAGWGPARQGRPAGRSPSFPADASREEKPCRSPSVAALASQHAQARASAAKGGASPARGPPKRACPALPCPAAWGGSQGKASLDYQTH